MRTDNWTGNEAVSVNGILVVLNDILETNPDFMQQLITSRFPCNDKLRDHPTVQVYCYNEASVEKPKAGFLGVLNGLIGVDKDIGGPIMASFDDNGRLVKFMLNQGEF